MQKAVPKPQENVVGEAVAEPIPTYQSSHWPGGPKTLAEKEKEVASLLRAKPKTFTQKEIDVLADVCYDTMVRAGAIVVSRHTLPGKFSDPLAWGVIITINRYIKPGKAYAPLHVKWFDGTENDVFPDDLLVIHKAMEYQQLYTSLHQQRERLLNPT